MWGILQNRDKNGAEHWMIGGISLSEGGKDKLSGYDETREQRHRNGDMWRGCLQNLEDKFNGMEIDILGTYEQYIIGNKLWRSLVI